ncbi:MAG: substrate-binding domain-containing protein [Clostridia bacterium]|nr:substrate-binding domain-containing protein [Clostridia bacterium]
MKKEKIRKITAVILFTVVYAFGALLLMSNFYDEYLLFFIFSAIMYIAEIIISKITKAKPYIFFFCVLFLTLFSLAVELIYPTFYFTLLTYALLFLAFRSGFLLIDFIRLKRYKLIPLSVVLCACLIFSASNTEILYRKYKDMIVGTADRTSSWGSINQIIEKQDNWHKIVENSSFTLGEIAEEVDDEGWVRQYSIGRTFPEMDGSTVCVPMAMEFARQHLGFDDEAVYDFVDFSTTHYAYENLITAAELYGAFTYNGRYMTDYKRDSVDLVIATHPSDEELKMAEDAGIELVLRPVCYDAFVFITHKDNPVESLTVQQVKDIYSGKIKNWKDVGGNDEKIRAFQREKNSGSQTAMDRLIMGGTDMIDPIEVKVIEGMGELVDAVAEYENNTASLGYTYRYYIDNLYKNDEIKTIAIEGIYPTDENIRSEAYPYTTNYYGVIRKENEKGRSGKFLEWILSEEGQKCVGQAGYITMK